MRSPLSLATIALAYTLCCPLAHAQFDSLWIVGNDDGTQAEFAQENGGQNAVDAGSAAALDDDYYFAGTNDSAGEVLLDEDWMTFERALVPTDPRNRIHFLLTADEAAPSTEFQLLVDMVQLGAAEGIPVSTHDVRILFNDKQIYQQADVTTDTFVDETFSAPFATAVEGENIITIERTGGSASSWIQFDFIELLAEVTTGGCEEPVCDFSASETLVQPGAPVTLTWFANPGSTLTIEPGVGAVTVGADGIGSTVVSPTATTTYTMIADLGGTMAAEETTVTVDIISSFTASGFVPLSEPIARPDQPIILSWTLADPDATLSIDNGVGDVTGLTDDEGNGSIALDGPLAPAGPATYTLTATRGPDDSETAMATVTGTSDWQLLWQVGTDNNGVEDFSQESFAPNPPPGDPFNLDDDYYTAGDYTDFDATIGVVAEPEPWNQFERAVTNGDPNIRIHFTATPEQAASKNEVRFRFDLFGGGWADSTPDGPGGIFGVHDVMVSLNGEPLFTQEGITAPVDFEEITLAGAANVLPGHNELEVTRFGGDSVGDGSDSGWILLDYVVGEVRSDPGGLGMRITDIFFDDFLGEIAVTWTSLPGLTYTIETSPDLANWTPDQAGIPSAGELTNSIVEVGFPIPEEFYIRVVQE